MLFMGRLSLAQKFLEQLNFKDRKDEKWIILYDFKGNKPSPNFWSNLNRIREILNDAPSTHNSVFLTTSMKGAVATERLIRHYGGEANVYKAKETQIQKLLGPPGSFVLQADELYYTMRSLAFDLNLMLSGKKPRKDIEVLNKFIVRTILGGELKPDKKNLEETKKVGREMQRIIKEEDPDSYQEEISWLYPFEITPVLSRVEMKLRENMGRGTTRENRALFSALWRLSNEYEAIPEINNETINALISKQPSHSHDHT
jgi:hypothetical protein